MTSVSTVKSSNSAVTGDLSALICGTRHLVMVGGILVVNCRSNFPVATSGMSTVSSNNPANISVVLAVVCIISDSVTVTSFSALILSSGIMVQVRDTSTARRSSLVSTSRKLVVWMVMPVVREH
ncbi:hypothetical protein GN958_ATG08901 [Phytophthora infestans]|uniref:Transmembrane protein n=1 Tax=Phytophthora infestans TaxID=4787 RepID=A0A8S9UM62_PHYIN|nr:hypothetical protein GN958_ATG08901 [Phytophthora infestans]